MAIHSDEVGPLAIVSELLGREGDLSHYIPDRAATIVQVKADEARRALDGYLIAASVWGKDQASERVSRYQERRAAERASREAANAPE